MACMVKHQEYTCSCQSGQCYRTIGDISLLVSLTKHELIQNRDQLKGNMFFLNNIMRANFRGGGI
jgi:hypothetical protein